MAVFLWLSGLEGQTEGQMTHERQFQHDVELKDFRRQSQGYGQDMLLTLGEHGNWSERCPLKQQLFRMGEWLRVFWQEGSLGKMGRQSTKVHSGTNAGWDLSALPEKHTVL